MSTDTQQDSTEIATRPREPLSLDPENGDHLWRLAQAISQSSIVPPSVRGNPANAFIVLLQGRELGLKPMQALASIHVIDGKAGMSAQLLVALCVQSPECEYFRCVETTVKGATYETKRRGSPEPVTLTFTMDDAKSYGLLNRRGSNYVSKPAVMLRWRAASQLARDVYPDITLGLYTEDELTEIEAPEAEVQPQSAGMDGLRSKLGHVRPEEPID